MFDRYCFSHDVSSVAPWSNCEVIFQLIRCYKNHRIIIIGNVKRIGLKTVCLHAANSTFSLYCPIILCLVLHRGIVVMNSSDSTYSIIVVDAFSLSFSLYLSSYTYTRSSINTYDTIQYNTTTVYQYNVIHCTIDNNYKVFGYTNIL